MKNNLLYNAIGKSRVSKPLMLIHQLFIEIEISRQIAVLVKVTERWLIKGFYFFSKGCIEFFGTCNKGISILHGSFMKLNVTVPVLVCQEVFGLKMINGGFGKEILIEIGFQTFIINRVDNL